MSASTAAAHVVAVGMLSRHSAAFALLIALVCCGCGNEARTPPGAPPTRAPEVPPVLPAAARPAGLAAPAPPVMSVVGGIPTFTFPARGGGGTDALFVFAAGEYRSAWSWIGSAPTVGYGDVEGAEGLADFVRRAGGRGAPAAPAPGWEWSWIAFDASGAIAATRARAR